MSGLAERVAGQRLCAGEVLELVSAEMFSELSIAPAIAEGFAERSAPRRHELESSRRGASSSSARAPARSLPHAVASLVSGLEEAEETQKLAWQLPCGVALLYQAVRETLRERAKQRLSDGQVFDAMLDAALLAWTLREPGARRADPVIERAPHELVFELGVRPGAPPLARYSSGDVALPTFERGGRVQVAA